MCVCFFHKENLAFVAFHMNFLDIDFKPRFLFRKCCGDLCSVQSCKLNYNRYLDILHANLNFRVVPAQEQAHLVLFCVQILYTIRNVHTHSWKMSDNDSWLQIYSNLSSRNYSHLLVAKITFQFSEKVKNRSLKRDLKTGCSVRRPAS